MAIPNGVKVAVAAVALAGAGYMTWKTFSKQEEGQDMFTTMTQYYRCSNKHEFTMTAGDARASARANNGIVLCPQCQAAAADCFQCPKCKKLMDPVGHGQMPPSCPFCKEKF